MQDHVQKTFIRHSLSLYTIITICWPKCPGLLLRWKRIFWRYQSTGWNV